MKRNRLFGISALPLIALVSLVATMLVVSGTSSKAVAQPSFDRVPDAKLNVAQKDKANEVGTDILTKWSKGEFQPLSDNFTSEMQKGLPPNKQEMAFHQIKELLGDFRSMEFAEAVASPAMPDLVVYRFKGTFANSPEKPEVRVVMNKEDKVAGFFVKPWMDTLQ
jgi:hypothetical protein